MLILISLIACHREPVHKESHDQSRVDSDTAVGLAIADTVADFTEMADPQINVVWDAQQESSEGPHEIMRLNIEGGHGTYQFGMAYLRESERYYFEACAELEDESEYVCHHADATGVTLLQIQSDNRAAGIQRLRDGESVTLLSGHFADYVSYLLVSDTSGKCWAYNASESPYIDMNCVQQDI